MNEGKRLLKNTGLIAIGNLGAKITSFLLLPLYTSILSTEEYGTYDFIVAVGAFLLPVVTICMHEAMFRFIIERGKHPDLFSNIVSHAFFAVLLGLLVLAAGIGIFNYIHPFDYWLLFLAYISANVLYTFAVNLLRGMGKMADYAVISSGKNILQIILNVLTIAVFRLGLYGLILSMFFSEMLAFVVTGIKCKLWKFIRIRHISKGTLREMLIYSLPLIPNAVCAQIINISDRLIISAMIGTASNGIYSISYKFPNIIETVYHYFYTAWSESASRVFEKGKSGAEQYYQSLYPIIDNLMFSIILLMTAGMPIMFRVFVRGDYVQGFVYVPMLMFAMYFDCLAKFYSGIFTALKQTKIMATSTIIAAIINIIINAALIWKIGLYAAAASTLIADIVLVIIRKNFISRLINLKINYKAVILKIIMVTVVAALYSYDNWMKIAVSIIVAGVYAIIVNRTIINSSVKSLVKKTRG